VGLRGAGAARQAADMARDLRDRRDGGARARRRRARAPRPRRLPQLRGLAAPAQGAPMGAGHDEIRRAAAVAAEQFRPAPGQGNAAAEEVAAAPPEASALPNAPQNFDDPYCIVDDRLDFGMQGYLDMAQGMLIDPPPMAGSSASGGDDDDDNGEVKLWSY